LAVNFQNRVVVLGAGSVSQTLVPLLLKEKTVDPKQITVVDKLDIRHRFQSSIAAGVTYIIDELTRSNIKEFLGKYLKKGDFLVDLAWNIEANVIMGWAHDNDVIYLNTSVEMWDPNSDPASRSPQDKISLYPPYEVTSIN
jgi:homospermidine synthase